MKLSSQRLELIAATPELLRAELDRPARLAALLEVAEPEIWPPPLNSAETVQYTLCFLEGGPDHAGWMSWYFVRKEGRVLVGQGGFSGRPEGGMVEVGYSLLEAHQGAVMRPRRCARSSITRSRLTGCTPSPPRRYPS